MQIVRMLSRLKWICSCRMRHAAGQAGTCSNTPLASQKATLQRVDVGAVAVWCSGANACHGNITMRDAC